MFRAKICGVRLKNEIEIAEAAGADAIGLNFFPKSIRYVAPTDDSTNELSATIKRLGMLSVGVFVNLSVDEVTDIAARVGLSAVQLHGDEPESVAQELISQGLKVIRAIKLPTKDLSTELITQKCQPWSQLGCHLLLDADAGAQHGGSGKCLSWDVIHQWATSTSATWTLAGGLTPENVSEAIQLSGAKSVDTASGAEQPRGTKSAARIEAFLASCKLGFDGNSTPRD